MLFIVSCNTQIQWGSAAISVTTDFAKSIVPDSAEYTPDTILVQIYDDTMTIEYEQSFPYGDTILVEGLLPGSKTVDGFIYNAADSCIGGDRTTTQITVGRVSDVDITATNTYIHTGGVANITIQSEVAVEGVIIFERRYTNDLSPRYEEEARITLASNTVHNETITLADAQYRIIFTLNASGEPQVNFYQFAWLYNGMITDVNLNLVQADLVPLTTGEVSLSYGYNFSLPNNVTLTFDPDKPVYTVNEVVTITAVLNSTSSPTYQNWYREDTGVSRSGVNSWEITSPVPATVSGRYEGLNGNLDLMFGEGFILRFVEP